MWFGLLVGCVSSFSAALQGCWCVVADARSLVCWISQVRWDSPRLIGSWSLLPLHSLGVAYSLLLDPPIRLLITRARLTHMECS